MKKNILKSILLVSTAVLAFTACGKKTTKENKTTKNNTQVTTSSQTQATTKVSTTSKKSTTATTAKKTTKKQTTAKKEVINSNKCYVNNTATDNYVIKTNVEDSEITNIIFMVNLYDSFIIRPVYENGKITKAACTRIGYTYDVFSLDYDYIYNNNKQALLGIIPDEKYQDSINFLYATVKDDRIVLSFKDEKFNIYNDGIKNNSDDDEEDLSELTSEYATYYFGGKKATMQFNDDTLQYSLKLYNFVEVTEVTRTISLNKDLVEIFDDSSSYSSYVSKYSVSFGDNTYTKEMTTYDDTTSFLVDSYTNTLNDEGLIISSKNNIDETDTYTYEYGLNSKTFKEYSGNTQTYEGYIEFDNYGRIIEILNYKVEDGAKTLTIESYLEYNNNGLVSLYSDNVYYVSSDTTKSEFTYNIKVYISELNH